MGDGKCFDKQQVLNHPITLLKSNGYLKMVPPPPRPPVICHDLAERDRLTRQRHSAMEAELDKLSSKIKSLKQAQDKVLETHGISHRAALYIQQLEEENQRLRHKYDQMLATRRNEAIKYTQHLRECQRLNRAPQTPTPTRPNKSSTFDRIPKTSTPAQIRRGNSQGSSSTISLTSSSGSSLDKTPLSFLPSPSTDDCTIELSAMQFFKGMEDQTMINVHELINRMTTHTEELKRL